MLGCLACSNLGLTISCLFSEVGKYYMPKPANFCLLIKTDEWEFNKSGRYDMMGCVPSFQIEWPVECWNMFPSATQNNVCQLQVGMSIWMWREPVQRKSTYILYGESQCDECRLIYMARAGATEVDLYIWREPLRPESTLYMARAVATEVDFIIKKVESPWVGMRVLTHSRIP